MYESTGLLFMDHQVHPVVLSHHSLSNFLSAVMCYVN